MSPQASLASATVALQNAQQHLQLQKQVQVEPVQDPALADNAERTAQRIKAVHQQALEEAVQDAVAVLREGFPQCFPVLTAPVPPAPPTPELAPSAVPAPEGAGVVPL